MTMHNPARPGEILRDLYLKPAGISIKRAAHAMRISSKHLSAIVNGRVRLRPKMAMRLALVLDTAPDIWINLQAQYDLWTITQQPRPKVKQLRSAA